MWAPSCLGSPNTPWVWGLASTQLMPPLHPGPFHPGEYDMHRRLPVGRREPGSCTSGVVPLLSAVPGRAGIFDSMLLAQSPSRRKHPPSVLQTLLSCQWIQPLPRVLACSQFCLQAASAPLR
jgi:hypothetical protein